jgi:hypothetical protein
MHGEALADRMKSKDENAVRATVKSGDIIDGERKAFNVYRHH